MAVLGPGDLITSNAAWHFLGKGPGLKTLALEIYQFKHSLSMMVQHCEELFPQLMYQRTCRLSLIYYRAVMFLRA
jgi:hypothetical protein